MVKLEYNRDDRIALLDGLLSVAQSHLTSSNKYSIITVPSQADLFCDKLCHVFELFTL